MEKYKISNLNPITAITSNKIDILIHSVTCTGVLAVGMAKQISIAFPIVDKINAKICREHNRKKRALIGTYSYAYDYINGRKIGFYNLYGQVEPGPLFEPQLAKEALKKALLNLGATKKSGKPIRYGITLIGTEFATISEGESMKLITDSLWELEYNKGLVFDLTIFNYET